MITFFVQEVFRKQGKQLKAYYRPIINDAGTIKADTLDGRVELMGTLEGHEFIAMIKETAKAVSEKTAEGFAVELPIGTFYPVIEATAVDTEKQVTARTIKNVKTGFKPSREFKTNLRREVLSIQRQDAFLRVAGKVHTDPNEDKSKRIDISRKRKNKSQGD